MAESKDKNAKSSKTDKSEEAESQAKQDYPIRPGTAGTEQPLDEALINEWDQQNTPVFDRLIEDEMLAPNLDGNGTGMSDAVHADTYKRISPEEFEEFDLLDTAREKTQDENGSQDPPMLKLLEDAEVDEIERIFDDEQEIGADDLLEPVVDTPIDMTEETAMDNEPAPQEEELPPYEEGLDEPPPNFEDRGMGGGFFVADDELQPTQHVMPEEAEYKPQVQMPEDEEEKSEPTTFASDLFFPPGPTFEIHDAPPVVGDLPADKDIIQKEVTDDRVSKLMYRAEMARRRINDEIDSIELARDLLELIRSSTTLILSGKDNYEEADRSLNEVEFRLSYSRRVKVWSEAIAYRLLAYEVFWLLVLGLGALFIPSILSALLSELSQVSPASLPDFIMLDDLFLGVSTALWGGLGGVVGAMYSLWRHVSLKQDFNPQHKMWYYTQPIMGIPIGVVIFLVVRIGIGFTVEGALNFDSPYGIYMLAWVAGFQQNILYEIIRQILKLFRIQN